MAGFGASGSGGQGFAIRLEADGDTKLGNSSGDLHQVTGTIDQLGTSFQITGDDPRIKINGITNSHPGLEFREDGTRKWIIFNNYVDDSLDFKTNSNTRMVINQDGTVGIGTESPSTTLDVAGDVNFDGSAVFNESSADKDFRVESNNHAHMFYVDGGANRIGIGTNSPQSVLHIIDPLEGTGAERDAIMILKSRKDVGIKLIADSDNSGENDNPFIDFYQDGSADTSGRNNRLGTIAMEGDADGTFTGSIGNAFFMDAFHPNVGHSNRPLQLANASTNGGHSARITLEGTNGYVGIHTTTPSTDLEVSGSTESHFFVTKVSEQDLGTGTSSTLSRTAGTILLDAGSINGQDMGGYEVHSLAVPRGSNSGTRLTLIAKGSTNNVILMPSGLISGSFGSMSDAAGTTSLEFVWISEGTHQAWHQV